MACEDGFDCKGNWRKFYLGEMLCDHREAKTQRTLYVKKKDNMMRSEPFTIPSMLTTLQRSIILKNLKYPAQLGKYF